MTMVAWPNVYWDRRTGQEAPMEEEAKEDTLLQNDAFWSVCDHRCNDAANKRLLECHSQVREPDKLSELVPLGLELQITPTLVNSIQDEVNRKYHQPTFSGAKPTKVSDLGPGERLKAACFNALSIQIGSWERKSVYENDLVAKIYFAKRKLVWEFLQDSRRKSKIEIQWSDIVGIRATMEENQPGVLLVELANPPSFQYEQEPQPRKHTTWQTAHDFTDGYASNYRRHLVTFPPGALERHIQKLFVAEPRLLQLSRQGFPTISSPYFDLRSNWPTNVSFSGFDGVYQPFGFQEPGSRSYAKCLSGGQVHGTASNVAYSSSTSPALYYHPVGGQARAAQGRSNDPRQLKASEKQSLQTTDPWNAILNLARDGTCPHFEHGSSSTTSIDHNVSCNGNVPMILDSQFNQTAPALSHSLSHVQLMMMHQNRGNLAYDPSARAAADYFSFHGDGALF